MSRSIIEALDRIAAALEKQSQLAQLANEYNAAFNERQYAANEEIVKNQEKMLHVQEEAVDLSKVSMVSKRSLS